MNLNTSLDGLKIFFQGLPTSGNFEPKEALVNWDYEPVASSDQSYIESYKIDIKNIKLSYAYNLDSSDIEPNSPESTLEMTPDKWSFDVILNRMEDLTYFSVEISTITVDFDKKNVEVLINY